MNSMLIGVNKFSKIFNLKDGYLMRQKNIKKITNLITLVIKMNAIIKTSYVIPNIILVSQNVISSKKWPIKNVSKQSAL